MIIMCDRCSTMEYHKEHIKWESKLKPGMWVGWENGLCGEYMTYWQGKIIEVGDPSENNYGHRSVLVQPEGDKTREWMNCSELFAYKKERAR